MTSIPTRDQFMSTLNQNYTITTDRGPINTRLIDVSDKKIRGPYESFSLLLEGNANEAVEQKIRKIRNDTLGDMELFICPVTTENAAAGKICYQVIFSNATPT